MQLGKRKFTRGELKTDEGHLVYLVSRGYGPSLLLIPGSFGDCFVFEEVVTHLSGDLMIAIAEIRGHGGSWPPPANGSIEQFGCDAIQVADAAGLDRFYVGGHSIGGMISLEVGHRCPERVKGIIPVEGWTRAEAAQGFGGIIVNTLSDDQIAKRQATRERVTRDWTEDQVKEFAKIWRRWDGYEFLAETSIPVLEIWGDRAQPKPALREILIPERDNVQVVWMEGASHSLLLERPKQVAEAISAFIRRTEATKGPVA